ncbi:hypothetical protein BJY16_008779 [Actinoplanes octamycinicus]|uniref:DUF3558 domain-containing protein n=1 Tax=Actinoplanes octamycinicus TaxID=135948 RepID=A0A7W7MD34_9ACTN|nr:hypothetical protein [Actinoplanes octamycinicus]MBB4745320.1 hypothetical protein [Actinoplanes octamycinicus]GIE62200.1 hypothetical protein Aoc01nite_76020 [Actinoplanes octamycinicus]
MIDAVWDPPPRRPRRYLSYLGLLIMVAVLATLAVVFWTGLQHPYAKAPAPCDRLGLSAVTTALGSQPPTAQPTGSDTVCQFGITAADGSPLAFAQVSLTYTEDVFRAWLHDRLHPAEGDEVDGARLTVSTSPTAPTCDLRVLVADGNLRAGLSLAFLADQAAKPCDRLDAWGTTAVRITRDFVAQL